MRTLAAVCQSAMLLAVLGALLAISACALDFPPPPQCSYLEGAPLVECLANVQTANATRTAAPPASSLTPQSH
jgi:hypothetical protein